MAFQGSSNARVSIHGAALPDWDAPTAGLRPITFGTSTARLEGAQHASLG